MLSETLDTENAAKCNELVFRNLYRAVNIGSVINAKTEYKEVMNCCFTIDPLYPITSFTERKLNLNYCKKETLWYLRGDRFDTSICDIAGTWQNLIQPDGGLNSNYGQVIFTGPKLIDWVVEELKRDSTSRRAVIILGDHNLLTKENSDHRCTLYISYMIRNNFLFQTVQMRSNDVIYGVTNDIFFFGILHQMVYTYLESWYPGLMLGMYTHMANSMHVYSHHYDMLKSILHGGNNWYFVDYPHLSSPKEVDWLRYCQRQEIPREYAFANWLHGRDWVKAEALGDEEFYYE